MPVRRFFGVTAPFYQQSVDQNPTAGVGWGRGERHVSDRQDQLGRVCGPAAQGKGADPERTGPAAAGVRQGGEQMGDRGFT